MNLKVFHAWWMYMLTEITSSSSTSHRQGVWITNVRHRSTQNPVVRCSNTLLEIHLSVAVAHFECPLESKLSLLYTVTPSGKWPELRSFLRGHHELGVCVQYLVCMPSSFTFCLLFLALIIYTWFQHKFHRCSGIQVLKTFSNWTIVGCSRRCQHS